MFKTTSIQEAVAPYKTLCFMSTRDLAVHMMCQMHAPEIVKEEFYVRHLAVFVS